MAYVIHHETKGIYLDTLACVDFWSSSCPPSLYFALTFASPDEATSYLSSRLGNTTEAVTFVEVVADVDRYASMHSCVNAGLKAWNSVCFDPKKHGLLASRLGAIYHLDVMFCTINGWYIGTYHKQEGALTRESDKYYRSYETVLAAFRSRNWTQRKSY